MWGEGLKASLLILQAGLLDGPGCKNLEFVSVWLPFLVGWRPSLVGMEAITVLLVARSH